MVKQNRADHELPQLCTNITSLDGDQAFMRCTKKY